MSVYRVIVCEDTRNNGCFFIDICFAAHQTHVGLIEMRKKLSPEASWLENAYLKDEGGDKIVLTYTEHRNKRLQEQQKELRRVVDQHILAMYRNMRKEGKNQTIKMSNGKVVEIICQPEGLNESHNAKGRRLNENCR